MAGCTSWSAIALSGVGSWSDRILQVNVFLTPAESLTQFSILGVGLVDLAKNNGSSVP